jgi:hypothetical protein
MMLRERKRFPFLSSLPALSGVDKWKSHVTQRENVGQKLRAGESCKLPKLAEVQTCEQKYIR